VIQFRKSSTWSGDQDASPLLPGGIAPAADRVQDLLRVRGVAHEAEVIQEDAEVLHVRDVYAREQRPDVCGEADSHRSFLVLGFGGRRSGRRRSWRGTWTTIRSEILEIR
jgi:hypothetical protein